MDFNQLVLEEINNPYKVIRDANEAEIKAINKELDDYNESSISKGWLVDLGGRKALVTPNSSKMQADGWDYLVFNTRGTFNGHSTPKTPITSKEGARNDLLDKAIKKWEFKKTLNPSTVKAFNELIDEL